VLRALWHLVLRGDQEEAPVGEREWYRELLAEPDAEEQLRLMARQSRIVKLRIGRVLEVIRTAAPSDPEIGALWERIQTDFHALQRGVVETLAEKQALRPSLDIDRATDILWTLNSPEVWQLLVVGRRWTPEEYEQWCADAACSQLLNLPA
jgi:hypothetical protein